MSQRTFYFFKRLKRDPIEKRKNTGPNFFSLLSLPDVIKKLKQHIYVET